MSWSMSASGACRDAADEAALIDKLRHALREHRAGTASASIYTQFHGGWVDLKQAPNTAVKGTGNR